MRSKSLSLMTILLPLGMLSAGWAEPPKKRVLWDGEKKPTGVGWVSPQGTDMSVAIQQKTVASKPNAAAFHLTRTSAFVECGWQWAPWYPAFTGTDFTPYDTLEVAIRIDGPRVPGDLLLSLASPGDHRCTGRVSLKKYTADLMDGKWHTLQIPLADLYAADRKDIETRFPGSVFDARHTIQVILGTWNADGDFTVFLDDLALVRQKSPAK